MFSMSYKASGLHSFFAIDKVSCTQLGSVQAGELMIMALCHQKLLFGAINTTYCHDHHSTTASF